jgi:hypothetical protein
MKSLAGKIEETRKEYGNSFNYIVSTISKCSKQFVYTVTGCVVVDIYNTLLFVLISEGL